MVLRRFIADPRLSHGNGPENKDTKIGHRIFGTFERRQTTLTDADYVDNPDIRRESIGKLLRTAESRRSAKLGEG
jgi:hypothetical protein